MIILAWIRLVIMLYEAAGSEGVYRRKVRLAHGCDIGGKDFLIAGSILFCSSCTYVTEN